MCDQCAVKNPEDQNPLPKGKKQPTGKRKEYLKAKHLVASIEEELRNLSNRLFEEMGKSERMATEPHYGELEKARVAAIDAFKSEHAAEYAKLEELREAASKARRDFAGYHYDCNHQNEDGTSALKPQWGFGMDPGDKAPTVRCEICSESWSAR